MPYVRCPKCGVRGYRAAPWSSEARCSDCGARIQVPRHGFTEAEVRDELYPGPKSIEHVERDGRPPSRPPKPR